MSQFITQLIGSLIVGFFGMYLGGLEKEQEIYRKCSTNQPGEIIDLQDNRFITCEAVLPPKK